MGDMTLRALAVLQQVTVICCEDTRHSRVLLERFGIATPTLSLHEHNEAGSIAALTDRLKAGESLALISDAGTPLLSDPGVRLVNACTALGIRVVPIPGASALLSALVACGLSVLPFTMLGFLERKGKAREDQLAMATSLRHSVVIYESPNRLTATIRDLMRLAGSEREASVARELTKQFEEIKRGTLAELAAYYEAVEPRGEIVLVLSGLQELEPSEEGLHAVAVSLREQGFRPRDIVRMLMDEHGVSRNLAYRLAHDT